MELLAPVGSVEHFAAAIQAGADGVYAGVPGFNARNPSRELRFDDLRAMAAHCREHGRAFYAAINSLVREEETARLITTLAELETVAPSALIVQDLGVINLVKRYFPTFEIHGSTLMLAHNSGSVEALARLGCSRVVLARELSLAEIDRIIKQSPIAIEIFIHGAMCFSYSGGCLFSSYHGGKSGLRGNCVQPCRRKYSVASASKSKSGKARSGYFFSMNDLEGIELVHEFQRIGVASLKIEGRLRSVNYVRQVVEAYRLVLDASAEERHNVIGEAKEMIAGALGRKSSTGFFMDEKGQGTIASSHSGNIGYYLGRVRKIIRDSSGTWALINPNQPLHVGERFRLHDEQSGERLGFTLKKCQKNDSGELRLGLPDSLGRQFVQGDLSLYRVDVVERTRNSENGSWFYPTPLKIGPQTLAEIREKSRNIFTQLGPTPQPERKKTPGQSGRRSVELWLRLDSVELALKSLPFTPDRFVLPIEKRALAATGQLKRYFGREKHRIIWALPSVLHDKSFPGLRKKIEVLINSGFRSFQISGFGQLGLFDMARVSLYGDFTLNLLNSAALRKAAALGLAGVQFSIETDRGNFAQALAAFKSSSSDPRARKNTSRRVEATRIQVGLTVYGAPPLFISRTVPAELSHHQKISSPRGEQFITTKKGGMSITRPVKPFSLLPYQHELQGSGVDYMVVDLSGMKAGTRELEELTARLNPRERLPRLPTFNYLGTLE